MKIDMFSALFKKTDDLIHGFFPLSQKFFFKTPLFALALSVFGVLHLHAFTLTVTQTPGGPGKDYTLSWTAPPKSTDSAKTFYFIYSEFGADAVDFPASPPYTPHANLIGSMIDQTSFRYTSTVGTRGFVVLSTDSVDASFNDQSNVVYHHFIHASQSNDSVIIDRTDGDGTQRGVDQTWKFSFYFDEDAYLSMKIFPPGTTFATDANGFYTGPSNPAISPIKVIASTSTRRARSGELGGGSIRASTSDDRWDSRTSSGIIVGNGIYYLLIQARLDPGQFAYGEGELREGAVITIPVDIIRILDLRTTGITLSKPTSNISYFLTGDALVRLVVANPGSRFTIDSNGDIQPINNAGVIDTSLIVSSKTFQREAGSNTETWDGTSSSGTLVSAGVYPVGISARDEYGNRALDNSGTDQPIFATVTLERTAGSTGGGGTSDTTAPSLRSISPSNGSTVNTRVSTVTIVLQDTGGSSVNVAGTNVTMRDPNGANVTFNRSNSGTDTITLTFSTPLSTNGTYTVSITAVDTTGNSASITSTFNVDVRLEEGSFKDSFVMFPNPAKNVTSASIRYDLNVDATVKMDIFNAVGERVYSETFTDTQNTGITHTWNLRNSSGEKVGSGVYLIRLKASGASSNVEAIKKLVVVQ